RGRRSPPDPAAPARGPARSRADRGGRRIHGRHREGGRGAWSQGPFQSLFDGERRGDQAWCPRGCRRGARIHGRRRTTRSGGHLGTARAPRTGVRHGGGCARRIGPGQRRPQRGQPVLQPAGKLDDRTPGGRPDLRVPGRARRPVPRAPAPASQRLQLPDHEHDGVFPQCIRGRLRAEPGGGARGQQQPHPPDQGWGEVPVDHLPPRHALLAAQAVRAGGDGLLHAGAGLLRLHVHHARQVHQHERPAVQCSRDRLPDRPGVGTDHGADVQAGSLVSVPTRAIGGFHTAGGRGMRPAVTATRWQWLVIAGCTLLALLARLYYVETAVIDGPIRGDAVAYFSYASNLADHGVFSSARPGTGEPLVPDSYRDPGYPFLVAVLMRWLGGEAWYPTLLQLQAMLGAATVGLALALARRWMTAPWLAAAGI